MKKLMVGLVILGALVGLWGIGHAVCKRDGPCGSVGPRPKVVFGRIRDVGHQVTYILYYPGAYEWSGKPCQYPQWVSRAEYEHVMGISEGD